MALMTTIDGDLLDYSMWIYEILTNSQDGKIHAIPPPSYFREYRVWADIRFRMEGLLFHLRDAFGDLKWKTSVEMSDAYALLGQLAIDMYESCHHWDASRYARIASAWNRINQLNVS